MPLSKSDLEQYKTLVIDKLFKAWGVTLAGTSYWMKVTDGGEPVWRIDSTNRKCSEGELVPCLGSALD